MKEKKNKIWTTLKIISAFWIISYIVAMFFTSGTEFSSGNVAVIPINNIITTSSTGSFSNPGASSENIVNFLDKADSNQNIKVILLDINSPGGSGVAAEEIGNKVKSIEKPVISVIREMGTSAAYWIASSSDYIFASRMSLTASIGVTGSYLDFSNLLKEYNVSYERYVSGDMKDMISPFKKDSKKERELFQNIIDDSLQFFIKEVSENRNLSIKKVEEVSDGRILLGSQAYELGLIDKLGTKQDALRYIEEKYNLTTIPVKYEEKVSITELLYGFTSKRSGKFINSDNSILFS